MKLLIQHVLRWVFLWSLLCVNCLVVLAQPRAISRPNVVIFLADDAGWGDYSVSGNRSVKTPAIDSIARDGISLDRFYVCPVCAPTRAEFLTGRYHPRGGVRGVSTGLERLSLEERTVADDFKAAGYATGAFGKWHNGTQWPYHPMARGFDEYIGHTSGHWGEYFDPPLEEGGKIIRGKGYIVDICTDRALGFIERNRGRPFLCYVPFTTPHSPWAAPAEDWQRWRDRPIEQKATVASEENIDQTRCAYAMLENQDRNVGRVLNRLKELGLEENTIVLYFSDNGPNAWRWNGGMKGKKGTTDEGGVRSVAFLRWPARFQGGQTLTNITGAIDLRPTLIELAGLEATGNKRMDGLSLVPLMDKRASDWPAPRILFSTWAGQISARTQTHRLDSRGRLFDMIRDPGQSTSINESHPKLAMDLQASVDRWRREMFGDTSVRATTSGVDPRPIPVGYREFPVTLLPARDGEPRGGVKRSSSAPNSSYFVNWRSLEDRLVWKVQVHTSGKYRVSLDYTCPVQDVGSTIQLEFRGSRVSGKVQPGWDPPLYTNQDTLPRPAGESRMKEFRGLDLGEIQLDRGEGELVLKAIEIPGATVMDLRRLTLTLVD